VYSVPSGSVLKVNDGNDLFAWTENKKSLIYAPFPLTDIHGRKDLVVNMGQERITQQKHKSVEFTQIRNTDPW